MRPDIRGKTEADVVKPVTPMAKNARRKGNGEEWLPDSRRTGFANRNANLQSARLESTERRGKPFIEASSGPRTNRARMTAGDHNATPSTKNLSRKIVPKILLNRLSRATDLTGRGAQATPLSLICTCTVPFERFWRICRSQLLRFLNDFAILVRPNPSPSAIRIGRG
jgi:hypothetical protein